MNTILFDDKSWSTLRPLTLTRPVSEIRVGILTLREKWERRLNNSVSYLTSDYLQEKYPLRTEDDNLWINASVCANADLVAAVRRLESNDLLFGEQGVVIAVRGGKQVADRLRKEEFAAFRSLEYSGECTRIIYPYHVFAYNAGELLLDFDLLTKGRKSAVLEDSVRIRGKYPVFLEEGAVVRYATINTDGGPVYIGKEAEIMEGVLIRGPLAMCEHAVLNMGAKVYGATTLGPYCKCGGELNNVVLSGIPIKHMMVFWEIRL